MSFKSFKYPSQTPRVEVHEISNVEVQFDELAKLPPKSLRPRHGWYLVIFLLPATLLIIGFVVGLSLLISNIHRFTPFTGFASGVLTPNPASCDLLVNSGTNFENAFTIDLRVAFHLSFASAKGLSILWDFLVGQGGRILMAYISYLVFMDGLAHLMETSAVSYDLYASVVFETTSIKSIWSASQALCTKLGARGRLFLAWIVLSTCYVLIYPALISAASGYVTPSTLGFRAPDQSFVTPQSDLFTDCYTVKHGWMIGLPNNTIIPGPPVHQMLVPGADDPSNPGYAKLNASYPQFMALWQHSLNDDAVMDDSDIISALTGDDSLDFGDSPETQSFKTNITFNGHLYVFHNKKFKPGVDYWLDYCYRNQKLPPDDLESKTQCLPQGYFAWGFSSLFLYIVLSFQIVWTVGMYVIWLDANIYSDLCRKRRKIGGPFRATLDLAEAIHNTLGDESCAYSQAELAQQLKNANGTLQYYATRNHVVGGVSHIGIGPAGAQKLTLEEGALYGANCQRRLK